MKYIVGQGIFFCREHKLPLSTDYLNSERKCRLPRNNSRHQICTRRSAWRCPEKVCFASVGKTHFFEICDANDKVLVPVQPEANVPGPSFVFDNHQGQDVPDANMDEFDCPQLTVDAGFQETNSFSTDSGCEPVYISNDSKFVPMHVLLNGECQLMNRLRYPKHIGKSSNGFFKTLFQLCRVGRCLFYNLKLVCSLAFL